MPDIKTHKHNVPLGKLAPDQISIPAEKWIKNSLFMLGRDECVEEMQRTLSEVYKSNANEFVLIRGITGSGKSLFVRKCLTDFVEYNKELKNKLKYIKIFTFPLVIKISRLFSFLSKILILIMIL